MNIKLINVIVCLLIGFCLAYDLNQEIPKPFGKFQTVVNSIRILLYGAKAEDDVEVKKDLFIDTTKGVLNSMDNLIDMIHVDEIIRIFFQSLVVITAQNRYDLIPEDFSEQYPEFGNFYLGLNGLLDTLKERGTTAVTIKELRPFIEYMSSDNFWKAFDDLHAEVKESRRLEKEAKEAKKQRDEEEL